MEIAFNQRAFKDMQDWKKSGNKKNIKRITELTAAILESPFTGIGKPGPLKHQSAGKWPGRINETHRYVDEVRGEIVYVFSSKGHYID